MTHGLINNTSYVACQDTSRLVQHIVEMCEAEGMRLVDRSQAGELHNLPGNECNTWCIGVHKGRLGWHALDAWPRDLLSEQHGSVGEPRLVNLCKRLKSSGFLLDISDGGAWGNVLMETDGDSWTLSGWWLESKDAEAQVYYGISIPDCANEDYEPRFTLLTPLQTMLENGRDFKKCGIPAESDGERACIYFADKLGGNTEDPPWFDWGTPESVLLYFNWPAQDRPMPDLLTEYLARLRGPSQQLHFYSKGTPILAGAEEARKNLRLK